MFAAIRAFVKHTPQVEALHRYEPSMSDRLDAAEGAEASIHGDNDAGNERGRVAGQPLGRADEFFRPAETAHRCSLNDGAGARGWLSGIVHEDRAVLRGHEKARCDRVHPNPFAMLS